MYFHTKSAVIGSIGTLAIGSVAYLLHKYLKINDEVMEVHFTHDKCEQEPNIKNVNLPRRNLKRIEDYINSAKKTIDAAVYLFNVEILRTAIVRAHERGVTVRIVGCTSMQGATGTQFGELQVAGIPVIFKADTTMHHKFCLIDTRDQTEDEKQKALRRKLKKSRSIKQKDTEEKSEKEINETENPAHIPKNGICITGSCNWTMQGFSSNCENIIITNHKFIVDSFRREFDRIWSEFVKAQM